MRQSFKMQDTVAKGRLRLKTGFVCAQRHIKINKLLAVLAGYDRGGKPTQADETYWPIGLAHWNRLKVYTRMPTIRLYC